MQSTATINISDEKIRGILCCAFEGGTNYWLRIDGYKLAPGLHFNDFRKGGKQQPKDNYWHWAELIPLVEGCCLELSDCSGEGDGKWTLNRAKILAGIQVMATKYPKHFADWMQENDDADTGDVFLQCCIFGEMIYG